MTTFTEELDDILESHLPEMFNALTPLNGLSTKVEARNAILNLVSERIIGEDEDRWVDMGDFTDKRNDFREEQRTTLYEGTKEETR